MVGEDLDRLAKYVVRRRVQIGYKTREEFAAATGLSVRTLGDIERARRLVGDATVARVEHELGWRPGAFQAILRSGEPELVEAAAAVAEPSTRGDVLDAVAEGDPEFSAIADGLRAIPQLSDQERVSLLTVLKALRGSASTRPSQQDGESNKGGNRHTG
ncbi:helix-turn-helix domain-containing protein [Nonomuraea polychroma]|uniref:helix-turn-helix domain-containing protein n=1 Tax=Nonomuraea polychroma TaxID=46176 RepID=UPI003D8E14E8